jgi:hypothetical protein
MDIYWNIFTMHGPMNVKFPNNTSKWQMEFNSEFKGLNWNINLWGCGDWIHLAQNRILWRDFLETVMNRLVKVLGS